MQGYSLHATSRKGNPSIINLMEVKGEISPKQFHCPVQYDFDRFLVKGELYLNGNLVGESQGLNLDDISQGDEDVTPSVNDNIYVVDGPGIEDNGTLFQGNTSQLRGKFTEVVDCTIGGHRQPCSSTIKWCSITSVVNTNQGNIRDTNATNLIRQNHSCF